MPAFCAKLRGQRVWSEAASVLFFLALPDEPNLWPLVSEALSSGKTVALPRFVSKSRGYVAAEVKTLQGELVVGHYRVLEPLPSCPEVPLNRLDLALVPGVAFDLYGRRLGRGKGYYDRLLAGFGGIKCGVAFDEQIVAEVPAGPQDVRLNCILTPTRWIET
jgi:5-formyltetrahydrofolate cyclo-ligase